MIAIIGKTPPPFGGVTVYTSRLIENIGKSDFKYSYFSLTIKFIINSFFLLRKYSVVHLIASDPRVRFYFSIYCKWTRKYLIITYTDNFGEFGRKWQNELNTLSVKYATVPIMLNTQSLNVGKLINNNAIMFSAFIPANKDLVEIEAINEKLAALKKFQIVFCTNAFDYCLDKSGRELYGILDLVKIFNQCPQLALIVSDPSGSYSKIIESQSLIKSDNIVLIKYNEFTFVGLIEFSDCVIRATTTDGDSLSIKEAQYSGKGVICSDCISRPKGVVLYETGSLPDLKNTIVNFRKSNVLNLYSPDNGYDQLKELYQSFSN